MNYNYVIKMESGKIYDVIIAGGGPVGIWAAYYAGFRGLKALLIEASGELGGQAIYLYPEKEITDLPGIPSITGRDLVNNLLAQLRSVDAEVILEAKLISVSSREDVRVAVTSKGTFEGRFLLLTPGVGSFIPNRLGNPEVERFENKGVYYLVKSKEDFRGKKVLIVGGGDSAVDWALELSSIASQVYLAHRRTEFRAAELSLKKAVQKGVKIFVPYVLESVSGNSWVEKAHLRNLADSSTISLDVDAVLLMLGHKLDLSSIKGFNVEMDRDGILVNENCVTSDPRVLAAGDIAAPRNGIKQRLLVVGFAQATTAINYISKALRPEQPTFVHSTAVASN